MKKVIIYFFVFIFLFNSVYAAMWNGQEYETKFDGVPNEILDNFKAKIIEKGISKDYFDEHFRLKNVEWNGDEWSNIRAEWDFKINDEFSVVYFSNAQKVTNDFIVTDKYIVDNGIAYSFDTTSLHEIGSIISKKETEKKMKECIGIKPERIRTRLTDDGSLLASIASPINNYRATINLETGETLCDPIKNVALEDEMPHTKYSLLQRILNWLNRLF